MRDRFVIRRTCPALKIVSSAVGSRPWNRPAPLRSEESAIAFIPVGRRRDRFWFLKTRALILISVDAEAGVIGREISEGGSPSADRAVIHRIGSGARKTLS
jgi:hypothetical protein